LSGILSAEVKNQQGRRVGFVNGAEKTCRKEQVRCTEEEKEAEQNNKNGRQASRFYSCSEHRHQAFFARHLAFTWLPRSAW
jgi:hypothetical protein